MNIFHKIAEFLSFKNLNVAHQTADANARMVSEYLKHIHLDNSGNGCVIFSNKQIHMHLTTKGNLIAIRDSSGKTLCNIQDIYRNDNHKVNGLYINAQICDCLQNVKFKHLKCLVPFVSVWCKTKIGSIKLPVYNYTGNLEKWGEISGCNDKTNKETILEIISLLTELEKHGIYLGANCSISDGLFNDIEEKRCYLLVEGLFSRDDSNSVLNESVLRLFEMIPESNTKRKKEINHLLYRAREGKIMSLNCMLHEYYLIIGKVKKEFTKIYVDVNNIETSLKPFTVDYTKAIKLLSIKNHPIIRGGITGFITRDVLRGNYSYADQRKKDLEKRGLTVGILENSDLKANQADDKALIRTIENDIKTCEGVKDGELKLGEVVVLSGDQHFANVKYKNNVTYYWPGKESTSAAIKNKKRSYNLVTNIHSALYFDREN